MLKSSGWWLVLLVMAGCAAVEPAPVEERKPTAQQAPTASKPAPAAKAGVTTPKGKDWRPDSYVVKRGDTLYSIGLEFGYDYREIAKANNLNPPYSLYVGQKLNFKGLKSDGTGTPIAAEAPGESTEGDVVVTPLNTVGPISAQPPVQATPLPPPLPVISEPKAIRQPYSLQALNAPPPAPTQQPGSSATAPAAPTTPAVPTSPGEPTKPADAATPGTVPPPEAPAQTPEGTAAAGSGEWLWPAQGKVIKGFSDTGSARGIDIAGTMGQPVVAAGPGKVIYSGADLRGYGKLVIIKHDSAFLSVYAHNSKILVKEGQQVAKGQKIAEMGNTDTDQVKLHFEIRQQGKSVDPMNFLTGNPG